MAYRSTGGGRPPELASKSAHSDIINDPAVKNYLENCHLPSLSDEIDRQDVKQKVLDLKRADSYVNPVKYVLAIDCGYSQSIVRKSFPSSKLALFRFGALLLNLDELDEIAEQPFISPKVMQKVKNIGTWNLVLPIAGIKYQEEESLLHSIRNTLDEFLNKKIHLFSDYEDNLISTLKWLLYSEYDQQSHVEDITINKCFLTPSCPAKNIVMPKNSTEYRCPKCQEKFLLIDFFRLHELIDEEQGASGIPIYVSSLIEQLLIFSYIKWAMMHNPDFLRQTLFLRDGPLAFFGQTAILHKYAKNLINYLQNYFLSWIGKVWKLCGSRFRNM